MKLCWDNIENIRLNKNGNFRDIVKKKTYHLEACKMCGREYLLERRNSKFRCQSCCQLGSNNPMYGRKHTDESKKKISDSRKGKCSGEKSPMYGRKHTDETKEKISKSRKGKCVGKENYMYGKHLSENTRKKMSENRKGENHPNWKGGVKKKNIPLYNTYATKLDWCEDVRRNSEDPNIMEVRCTHCSKWYVPKLTNVRNRIKYLRGNVNSEHRFYCSKGCKKVCPIYGKTPETLMREDAVRAGRLSWLKMSREVQSELREMVLERDNHTCRKCGSKDKPLHCHHIDPVAINPIESADMDNCITLCEDCHKEAHNKDGCRYGQLRECEDYE